METILLPTQNTTSVVIKHHLGGISFCFAFVFCFKIVVSSVPSTPLGSHYTRMNLLVGTNMVRIIAVSNEITQSIKFKTINYLVIKEHTS